MAQNKGKINVITLGCSKNLVDSELLMSQLQHNQFDVLAQDGEVLTSEAKAPLDAPLCRHQHVHGLLLVLWRILKREVPEEHPRRRTGRHRSNHQSTTTVVRLDVERVVRRRRLRKVHTIALPSGLYLNCGFGKTVGKSVQDVAGARVHATSR